MLETEGLSDAVQVERLMLAAWLRLDGQELVSRALRSDGRVLYTFKRTAETDSLVRSWNEKTKIGITLSSF